MVFALLTALGCRPDQSAGSNASNLWITNAAAAEPVQGAMTGAAPPPGYGQGAGWQQLNPELLTPSGAPVFLVPSQAPAVLPTLNGILPPGVRSLHLSTAAATQR